MSSLKTLSQGISYNFVAVLNSRGLAVVTAVIIARALGTEMFGLYSFLMAIIVVAMTVADFGISAALQKYLLNFGQHSASSVIGCAFAGKGMISLVISAALLVSDYWFGFLRGYGYYAALIIVFSSFNLAAMSLNAELKFKHSALAQIMIEAVFAASVVAAAYFSWPITYLFIWRGLSYLIIGLPILVFIVKPKWLSIIRKFHIFRKILKFGLLSTLLAFLSALFSQSGLILLGLMNGFESTGILKAALSLSTLVMVVPEILRTPLLPVISNMIQLENGNQLVIEMHRKILKWITILLIPLLVAGILLAKPIITFVFGSGYTDAVIPFRVLLVVNCLAAVTISYFSIFYMDGGIKTLIYIGIASAIISLAGNYILIPKYGPTGSAVATLLAQIVGVIWIVCAFTSKYGTKVPVTKTELI
jgi:O-antigen/teichoic acid export membrane protein